MTDYSQLVKRLRITPAVSNETLAARIAMDEAADAIDALQARVAELEAGLASVSARADAATPGRPRHKRPADRSGASG